MRGRDADGFATRIRRPEPAVSPVPDSGVPDGQRRTVGRDTYCPASYQRATRILMAPTGQSHSQMKQPWQSSSYMANG